ncbi:MAG: pyruvate kinase, partial [Chloroflexota bacterium]|nr:pyruvate kinase [Chloroflexota bacterium]
MERRVKIVATLGPSVAQPAALRELIAAGVDVVRINAAHGSTETRTRFVEEVRAAAAEQGKQVPILFDLQGLKIRTGPLGDGEKAVPIARGSVVEVIAEPEPSTPTRVGVGYPRLLEVIEPGSRMLISDGLIELLIERVENGVAQARVGRGGPLLGRQGVTLPG